MDNLKYRIADQPALDDIVNDIPPILTDLWNNQQIYIKCHI